MIESYLILLVSSVLLAMSLFALRTHLLKPETVTDYNFVSTLEKDIFVLTPKEKPLISNRFCTNPVTKQIPPYKSQVFGRCKFCGGLKTNGVCVQCKTITVCSWCKKIVRADNNTTCVSSVQRCDNDYTICNKCSKIVIAQASGELCSQ